MPAGLKPSLLQWLEDAYFLSDTTMGEVYPQRELILQLARITDRDLPEHPVTFRRRRVRR